MKKIFKNCLANELYYDAVGRVVITDQVIMQAINGAISLNAKHWLDATNVQCPIFNTGCVNERCEFLRKEEI